MANELDAVVGLRVRSMRKAARFSQQRLAELFGLGIGRPVDPTTITRLEQGKRPITITDVSVLAEIFKVEVAGLIRTDGQIDSELKVRMARKEVAELTRELRRAEARLSQLEDGGPWGYE